jgi:heavy metal translocating P-type ATPase
MWCTACSWLVEEVLRKTKGILEARVSFLSDLVKIEYLPHEIGLERVFGIVSGLGYHASHIQDSWQSSPEKKDLLIRLGVSSFLTSNVMMISFALYFGFFQDLGGEAVRILSYPIGALATPVIFYCGWPILKRAVIGLRHLRASMDTLISIGSLAAYAYSVLQLFRGSLHLYFDTASMLITIVLLGKYIEARSRDKISRGIRELYQLAGQKVRLWIDGRERWTTPEAVEIGQQFMVLGGERVPMDGRILSGRADFDESVLTGESRPVRKEPGEEVSGGALLLEGQLRLAATRRSSESFLGQIIDLMQQALTQRDTFEVFSDRIMQWFVPFILLLSGGTAFYLLSTGVSTEAALLRGVTVLVITCPCALGIASPLAKLAAIAIGRTMGILVRDPVALEAVKDLDVMIFDKTGTVTQGKFLLQKIVTSEVAETEAEVLRRIASVESRSDHFLAREIVRAARKASIEMGEVRSFEALEGLGVKGRVSGTEVVVGNRKLMEATGMALPSVLEEEAKLLESKGMTVAFFAWQGAVQGFLVFGDAVKEGATGTVERLKKMGIEVWLVSGDSEKTTRAIADELSIRQVVGEALPGKKMDLVKRLQEWGHRVGMVGDGFNDAAALSRADVGIAIGARANLPQEASDINLLVDDPARVLDLIRLSALTKKTIRQNLALAFLYNGLGIPLAMAGLLNPLVAVFAMFASSLSVIGNTLRIHRRFRPKKVGIELGCYEDGTDN